METAAAFYAHNLKLVKTCRRWRTRRAAPTYWCPRKPSPRFTKRVFRPKSPPGPTSKKWLKAEDQATLSPTERAELRGSRDQSLRLSREQLMRHGAEAITEEQFPKTLCLAT